MSGNSKNRLTPLLRLTILSGGFFISGWAHATTWPFPSTVTYFNGISGTVGECRSRTQSPPACNRFHTGVDIVPNYPLTCGTTIYAAITGTAHYDVQTVGGYFISIGAPGGQTTYLYAHISTPAFSVPIDVSVVEGSSIALVGNTGTGTTGCHLHFETDIPDYPGSPFAQDFPGNPLLEFPVPDSTNGSIDEIVFHQNGSSKTITSGTALNWQGAAQLLVRGEDYSPLNASVNWYGFKAIVDSGPIVAYWNFDRLGSGNGLNFSGWPPSPLSVFSQSNPASSWVPKVLWFQMGSLPLTTGTHNICIYGYDLNSSQQRLSAQTCASFLVDNIPPTIIFQDSNNIPWSNQATTSSTTIVVAGNDDASGVYTIQLTGPNGFIQTSTNPSPSPSAPAYSASFSTDGVTPLLDGSYTATVTDLAGNSSAQIFSVKTVGPAASLVDGNGTALPITSTIPDALYETIRATADYSGIDHITYNGITEYFHCAQIADLGPFNGLSLGAHPVNVADCAGNQLQSPVTVNITTGTSAVLSMTAKSPALTQSTTIYPTSSDMLTGSSIVTFQSDTGVTNFGGSQQTDWQWVCTEQVASAIGSPISSATFSAAGGCHMRQSGGNTWVETDYNTGSLINFAFSVTNSTNINTGFGITVSYSGGTASAQLHFTTAQLNMTPGSSLTGNVSVSGGGQPKSTSSPDLVASSIQSIPGITVNKCTPANNVLQELTAQLLASILPDDNPYCWAGSEAVLLSSASMTFSFQERAGVSIDTTTLGIYGYNLDTSQWTQSVVTNSSVTISSTGYVVAVGSISRTGVFGVFFQGHDSSAPVTSLSIQGSSWTFAGVPYFSTSTYIILSATDPVVNGFASKVATITYRLDPSLGGSFLVYTTSIPVLLGTHVLQYRSQDYAGNLEAINTTTFTATAGTVFKNTSDQLVSGGNFLIGFLGSGAQAEITSQAQNALTLNVSSPNWQSQLSVSNIGNVGIGVLSPRAQLDVGSATIVAQLRAGNLTAGGTSAQIAFGRNGDHAMSHVLATHHSATAPGNSMDFLVWTKDAGSTGTLATADYLSLQAMTAASGGSMHVIPSGTADAEVEVSNGSSTGGGTMQRYRWVTPSSRRFKSDIKYFSEKDEDRALDEVAALHHVRFRYKSRGKDGVLYDDPRQPERVGLIYEEVPESLRGPDEILPTNERIAELELALRAAMRKVEALEKRYAKLQEKRKP